MLRLLWPSCPFPPLGISPWPPSRFLSFAFPLDSGADQDCRRKGDCCRADNVVGMRH